MSVTAGTNYYRERIKQRYVRGLLKRAREVEEELTRLGLGNKNEEIQTNLKSEKYLILKPKKFRYFPKNNFSYKRSTLALVLAIFLVLSNSIVFLSAFEAHVINVTAKIEMPEEVCTLIDFESAPIGGVLPAGKTISNQYSPYGVLISAKNNNSHHPDRAIIFDSTNPSDDDFDLGTPNEGFGGPGIGAGGAPLSPGENQFAQGNILIIAENDTDGNGDGLVDVPDDEAAGGTLKFIFSEPTYVEDVLLIDIDEGKARIELFDESGVNFVTYYGQVYGDNSIQRVLIDEDSVKELRIVLKGSGAVDDLCVKKTPPVVQCNSLSIGYWGNHEGCSGGNGSSVWTSEINSLSSSLSGVFSSYTGEDICENLWIPNCPSGNTAESKLCKANAHTLADELNQVSGRLSPNALLAGADDGSSSFDNLGLTEASTVVEALLAVESILADSEATTAELTDALHVAERIYTFYEDENPIAPQCVLSLADIGWVEGNQELFGGSTADSLKSDDTDEDNNEERNTRPLQEGRLGDETGSRTANNLLESQNGGTTIEEFDTEEGTSTPEAIDLSFNASTTATSTEQETGTITDVEIEQDKATTTPEDISETSSSQDNLGQATSTNSGQATTTEEIIEEDENIPEEESGDTQEEEQIPNNVEEGVIEEDAIIEGSDSGDEATPDQDLDNSTNGQGEEEIVVDETRP